MQSAEFKVKNKSVEDGALDVPFSPFFSLTFSSGYGTMIGKNKKERHIVSLEAKDEEITRN